MRWSTVKIGSASEKTRRSGYTNWKIGLNVRSKEEGPNLHNELL